MQRLDVVDFHDDRLTLTLECSAGFYVRSLAHDLGVHIGTGAHLIALRRTRSGDCTLADAIPFVIAEANPQRAVDHVIPPARMLVGLPSIVLTAEGVIRAMHGRDLRPRDAHDATGFGSWDLGFASEHTRSESQTPNPESPPLIRLLDPAGDLIGIARPSAPGLLHPSVVLV